MDMENAISREARSSSKVVSEYFSSKPVMDNSTREIKNKKKNIEKKPLAKPEKSRKRRSKNNNGQKDIRTLIASKKNDLLKYTKDFGLICKQSGIDVDPEQLQLAIALSKSLQDNNSSNCEATNTEKSLTCNQRRNKIRITLQEYGFESKKPPAKKVKKYRKPYKLLLVPDTEKQQNIADKYAQILINNLTNSKLNYVNLANVDNSNSFLYNLATNISYETVKNDELFYINELVPKCLFKRHKFKDWSKIPGRPVSPKLERADINIKWIKFCLQELDTILSGPIEIAQDIIKKNYKNIGANAGSISGVVEHTLTKEIEINHHNSVECGFVKGLNKIMYENNSEDCVITKSIDVLSPEFSHNMNPQINRSCSPDLFDDEVTIIMDSYDDKISMQKTVTSIEERLSEKTMTIKDQKVMDLTDCVGVIHCHNKNYTQHLSSECLSQGDNRTNMNSYDFMDLTTCVAACSQKLSKDVQSSFNFVNKNENNCMVKDNNVQKKVDLTQNIIINKNNDSDEKSLEDTIIMIDEEYSNIIHNKNRNVVSSTSKETVFIDLVAGECKNTTLKVNEVVDLEKDLESNIVNNFHKNIPTKINANQDNWNNVQNSKSPEENKNSDEIDLTQSSNFEECLSFVNINSVKSITYNTENKCDHMSNYTAQQLNKSTECCMLNHEHKDDDSLEQIKPMDLTQSSYSENSLQIKDCPDILLNSIITTNNGDCNLVRDYKYANVKLSLSSPEHDYSYNSKVIHNSVIDQYADTIKKSGQAVAVFNIESDLEFDNLIEKVSNRKLSNQSEHSTNGNLSKSCSFKKYSDNGELVLTQYSHCSSEKNYEQDKLSNMNDNAHNYSFVNNEPQVIENKFTHKSQNYTNFENQFSHYNVKSSNLMQKVVENVSENMQCSRDILKLFDGIEDLKLKNTNMGGNEIIMHDQNSDIDLTQQSDSSESTLCSPKVIEVPDELGKRNNVSIDYDEVCDKANNTRNYGITSSFDVDGEKGGENLSKNVSNSSQHSEVFELSDNEFNYSINQHLQNNDPLTIKPTSFNIGGISTIDNFLSQNSLSKSSTLRCSCNSYGEYYTKENNDENCLQISTTKNYELMIIDNKSKSCEEVEFVNITTPCKSITANNILTAKTPNHEDYIIKTAQVTPMPNYEMMTTPERNEELDKFGVKPLKRKRAIKLLTHIYNQTHPLMEVLSETEEYSSPPKIRRRDNVEFLPRKTTVLQMDRLMVTNYTESSGPILNIFESNSSQKSSTSCKELSQNLDTSSKMKHASSESKSSNKENALYEETTLMPVIRDIECCPDDWIYQKREKAKVHSCRVPLHVAFHNYVSSRTALREAILKYEPINIDDVHKGLVANGYRYNPKDLLKFMDRKCITVKTADNSRKNKNN